MKITDIRCHVLLDPGIVLDATSSAQDDLVVEILTDEGLVGIGESDINGWVGRALIEAPGTHTMDRGLKASLLGVDPMAVEPRQLWDRIYVATAMTGRRGALIHAFGAIDVALWDLRGKAAGVPTWQLLGERVQQPASPYASLLPNAPTFDEMLRSLVDQTVHARQLGFRAAKLELVMFGPYASMGMAEDDGRMVEIIAAVREAVGPDFVIMVDVGYGWDSVTRARQVIETWAEYDLYFVETPLWADDFDGYAELARTSPIPIAAGEWLATRFEFRDLVERGCLHVLQPDVGRVGGLTEAQRVCELASDHGLRVVPHSWKTGLTVAATAQLAQVTPNMPFFECIPRELGESALRRDLLRREPEVRDGAIVLPDQPGLGIEIDQEAFDRFEAAARDWDGRRMPDNR
jgi:L-alanine-DL-glutamate epimerase-like enolase superfamily enzyme